MPARRYGGCFLFYRKFLRIPYKIKNNYRIAAEKKYAAKAASRRRRILQSRILCYFLKFTYSKNKQFVKYGNVRKDLLKSTNIWAIIKYITEF